MPRHMQAMGASMSGPDAQARHRALVHAICALGIVHAQYRRALMLAERADGGERRTALAEARRVLGEAVALSGRARALQAWEDASVQAPESQEPRRRGPGQHASRLRAA